MKYAKVYLYHLIACLLYLQHPAERAYSCLARLRAEGGKGLENEAAVKRIEMQAMSDLQDHLKREFTYSEFWPNLPDKLATAEPVMYSQDMIADAAKAWSYATVNEVVDAEEWTMDV